jgi:two-component system, chemotaxis family, chemotaxis protein CheY
MITDKNISVLVVDDSEYVRTIITTLFRKEGITNIHLAGDGVVAVEKFKEVNPSLVILDIMLPKKGGMDVLKDIMQINPHSKVIMISSLASMDFIDEAKKLGASYYFVKPFDNQRFIKEAKELLNTTIS